jgi:hypothetical protein
MRAFWSLVLGLVCVSSVASANQHVERYPGKVKVLVDLQIAPGGGDVDILFVVDNSGSMATHQQNLSRHIPLLVAELEKRNLDYHAGVITTDMEGYDGTASKGRLVGSPAVIDRSIPNATQILATRLLVGINGPGTESVFAPIQAALSEPLLSTTNAGFLRPDAGLALVLVTDAEDQSQIPADNLAGFLTNLKGSLANVTAQGLLVLAEDPNCPRDEQGVLPQQIEKFISLLSGQTFNLCSVDSRADLTIMGQNIAKVAKGGSAPRANVSEIPLPSKPMFDSIQVVYGAQTLVKGDLVHGWVYDAKSNKVLLGEQIPWLQQPSGTQLELTYVPEEWN